MLAGKSHPSIGSTYMLSEIENGYYATISQLVKMNNSPAVIGGD